MSPRHPWSAIKRLSNRIDKRICNNKFLVIKSCLYQNYNNLSLVISGPGRLPITADRNTNNVPQDYKNRVQHSKSTLFHISNYFIALQQVFERSNRTEPEFFCVTVKKKKWKRLLLLRLLLCWRWLVLPKTLKSSNRNWLTTAWIHGSTGRLHNTKSSC